MGACVKQFSRLPGVMKTGALKEQLLSLGPVIGPPLDERTDRSGGTLGYQDKRYTVLSMCYSIPSCRGRGNAETASQPVPSPSIDS